VHDDQKDRLDEFFKLNSYVAGSYNKTEDFEKLNNEIKKLESAVGPANRLFYLALPPSVYEDVASHIQRSRTDFIIFKTNNWPSSYHLACLYLTKHGKEPIKVVWWATERAQCCLIAVHSEEQ